MKPTTFETATPRHLLYVEGYEDAREMLVCLLEAEGYQMTGAGTVSEGLEVIKRERFDLIILDARFSDGCGVELCRQIRAFDPFIPIIFYSSLACAPDIAAGLAAGAQRYLTKPMGIYVIRQTIAGLLSEGKATQAGRQSNYLIN